MTSVLGVMLSFLVASLNDEVKIVFIDGALENGTVRSIRGRIVKETDSSITIERSNGTLTIGKNFIIKIENWHNGRQQFDY